MGPIGGNECKLIGQAKRTSSIRCITFPKIYGQVIFESQVSMFELLKHYNGIALSIDEHCICFIIYLNDLLWVNTSQ